MSASLPLPKVAVQFDPAVDPDPVPSPCVSACKISLVDGWCESCTRSLDEIKAWRAADNDARRAIWRNLPDRRAQRLAELAQAADRKLA
ncbi:DUF1289 domain-containing protein [Pigmentiphaga aceris]|uniref:DUF1289 domain-containing protein n=1 Tax=Pigmentiphaga aceris TaxID=1940612 RepID=A0A5C0ASJ8_9BURK|nr:DUF1289 domain-containing protein [Pigmentiphaga aceris]QEI04616.1 DUF1289 domain-containing protein [Pigmentiphaga aceris]